MSYYARSVKVTILLILSIDCGQGVEMKWQTLLRRQMAEGLLFLVVVWESHIIIIVSIVCINGKTE